MSKRAERQETFRRHIEAAERDGIPLRQYAMKHDVSLQALYRYRKLLRQAPATKAPSFVRIERTAPAAPIDLEVRLPNGVRVSIPGDHPRLEHVLAALSAL